MSEKAPPIEWTTMMKNQLASLWRRNFSVLEIAQEMKLTFEQVKGAIGRARQGVWGEEFQTVFARDGQTPPKPAPKAAMQKSLKEISPAPEPPKKLSMVNEISRLTEYVDYIVGHEITHVEASREKNYATVAFTYHGASYVLDLREV